MSTNYTTENVEVAPAPTSATSFTDQPQPAAKPESVDIGKLYVHPSGPNVKEIPGDSVAATSSPSHSQVLVGEVLSAVIWYAATEYGLPPELLPLLYSAAKEAIKKMGG